MADINQDVSCHVETVVQLVRKTPDVYIDITVEMDELDLTASEAKATLRGTEDVKIKCNKKEKQIIEDVMSS